MPPQKADSDLQQPPGYEPSNTFVIANLDFVNGKHDLSRSDFEDGPFKPSEKRLLVIRGLINGAPDLVPIDPSADINHISDEFSKKALIRTTAASCKVQLTNKSTENMRFTRNRVIISLGGYTGSFRTAANPLNYDVILGKK